MPSILTVDPNIKHNLSHEEKDKLLSLLLSEKSGPSKQSSPLNVSYDKVVFTPINPASGNAAPTFVPIPYPVPAVAPQPMGSFWYLSSNAPVPFAPQNTVSSQYDPMSPMAVIHPHSRSSDRDSEKNVMECKSRLQAQSIPNPVPKNVLDNGKEIKDKQPSVLTKASRIPRPVWNTSSWHTRRRVNKSSTINNQDIPSENVSPERSRKYVNSGLIHNEDKMFNNKNKKAPLSRESSRVSSQSVSPLNTKRPGSPMENSKHFTAIRQCEKDSNSHLSGSTAKGNRSKPASPTSRSTSPVAALISKFEDLSNMELENGQAENKSTTVSSMISKLVFKSLLKEERLTKKQFKPGTTPEDDASTTRPGPMRPSSAQNEYRHREHVIRSSEKPVQDIYHCDNASAEYFLGNSSAVSTSSDSLPCRGDSHIKSDSNGGKRQRLPLSPENRQKLYSSLDNLYGREIKTSTRENTFFGNKSLNRKKWNSLESIPVGTADSRTNAELDHVLSKKSRQRSQSFDDIPTTLENYHQQHDSAVPPFSGSNKSKYLSWSLENIARKYPDSNEKDTFLSQNRRLSSTTGIPISNYFSEVSDLFEKEHRHNDTNHHSTVGANIRKKSQAESESSAKDLHFYAHERLDTAQSPKKTSYDDTTELFSKYKDSNKISDFSKLQLSYSFQTPEKEISCNNAYVSKHNTSMLEHYSKMFDTPVNNATTDCSSDYLSSKTTLNSRVTCASSMKKPSDSFQEQSVSSTLPPSLDSSKNRLLAQDPVQMKFEKNTVMEAERDLHYMYKGDSELKENFTTISLNEKDKTIFESTKNKGKSQDYLKRFEKRLQCSGSKDENDRNWLNPKATRKSTSEKLTSNVKINQGRNPNSVTKEATAAKTAAISDCKSHTYATSSSVEPNYNKKELKTKKKPPNLNLQSANTAFEKGEFESFDTEKTENILTLEANVSHSKNEQHSFGSRQPKFNSVHNIRSKSESQNLATTRVSNRRQSIPGVQINKQTQVQQDGKSASNPATPNVKNAKMDADFTAVISNTNEKPEISKVSLGDADKPINKVHSVTSNNYRNTRKTNISFAKNAEKPRRSNEKSSSTPNVLPQQSVTTESSHESHPNVSNNSTSGQVASTQSSVATVHFFRRQSSPNMRASGQTDMSLGQISASLPTSPNDASKDNIESITSSSIVKQDSHVKGPPISSTLVQFFDRVQRTASKKSRPSSSASTVSKPKLYSTKSMPALTSFGTAQSLESLFKEQSSGCAKHETCSSNLEQTVDSGSSASQVKTETPSSGSPLAKDKSATRKGKLPVNNKFFYEPDNTTSALTFSNPVSAINPSPVSLCHYKNAVTYPNIQDARLGSKFEGQHVNSSDGISNTMRDIQNSEENMESKTSKIAKPNDGKTTTNQGKPDVPRNKTNLDEVVSTSKTNEVLRFYNIEKKMSKSLADKHNKTRAPSPGRLDSKELLGHLVKKFLTSVAAKQSNSPTNSFLADKSSDTQTDTPFSRNESYIIPSLYEADISSTQSEKSGVTFPDAKQDTTLPSKGFSKVHCEKDVVTTKSELRSSQQTLKSTCETTVSEKPSLV